MITRPVKAQPDLKFRHYTLEDGLSQLSGLSILQDSKGFIWIGTFDGLNRFDGYSYKIYKHDPQDATSISDNTIWALLEDNRGNIWVGTNAGGLNLFDPKTETFEHFRHSEDDLESISDDVVWALSESKTGDLWIGTHKGLDHFDYESRKFKHFKHDEDDPNSISGDIIRSLFKDSEDNLWIGTQETGLNLFDPINQGFSNFQYSRNDIIPVNNSTIRAMSEDSRGNLWIGTESGLRNFDRDLKTYDYEQSYLSNGIITNILEDSKGNLWVGSWFNGLNLFNYDTRTFFNFRHSNTDPTSLTGDRLEGLMEDNLGNLWVGTLTDGINVFDPQCLSFGHFKHSENHNSLSNDYVRSFLEEENGNLWVGTSGGGLNYFDFKNQLVKHYNHSEDNPASISNNYIRTLLIDSNDNFWIGTNGGGVDVLDIASQSFRHFKFSENDSSSISSNVIYRIIEDTKGNIWLSTHGGLNKYVSRTQSFERFMHSESDSTSIIDNFTFALIEDSKGYLWIGTLRGLDRFDPKNNTFEHFVNSNENNSLSNNFVRSLYQDSKGRLWAGTSGGLNLFIPESGSFKRYGTKEGLSNEVIYGILEDESGKLWISTNVGINKFDPDTENFTWYSTEDGLQGNEFNTCGYYKGPSGKLYFGGVNGFNAFYPNDITENTFIPPVVFTEFLLFNKPISINDTMALHQSINEIKEIELNYDDFIFGFEFSALNYRQPEKNQFAYKLDGFDKNWTYTDYKYRRATYTNIPPGNYVFKVKASNDDGYWNQEGVSVKLLILPPWWETWWAYSLWIVLIVGSLISFYKIRVSSLKRQRTLLELEVSSRTEEIVSQNENLEELNREKDGMINIVAHDLNSPLNRIKGFMQLMPMVGDLNPEQKDYLDKVDGIINQGSHLIRDLLDVHAFEYKDAKLETETIALDEIIPSWLESYNQEFARKEQILQINIKKKNLRITTSKDLLLRILDNILTNAIKFSDKGKNIYLKIWDEENKMKFSIRDEGPGISIKDQKKLFKKFQRLNAIPTGGESSSGLGMAIIKALVNKLGGKIEVHSQLGEGTTFIITIPNIE